MEALAGAVWDEAVALVEAARPMVDRVATRAAETLQEAGVREQLDGVIGMVKEAVGMATSPTREPLGVSFQHLGGDGAVKACLGLGLLYVGSLYVWPSTLPRDHPTTIRRRMASVLAVSAVSPFVLSSLSRQAVGGWPSVASAMGLVVPGSLLAAIAAPLLVNVSLFLGPIVQDHIDGQLNIARDVKLFWDDLRQGGLVSQVCLRNFVIAPATEEFVFRGAMVPLLLGYLGPTGTALVSPLFFGLAHLHHILAGKPVPLVALQFLYTWAFGVFTAHVFIRTGTIWAPILCHAFSNYMGLPDFGGAYNHPKRVVRICYVAGLVTFLGLLAIGIY